MQELRKKDDTSYVVKINGLHVATCNVAGQHSYDEIVILRQEPIGEKLMTETLTELCEMFNRPISGTLVRLFTRKLEETCGKTEYAAAIEDFWMSIHPGFRFENFLHWIANHVKDQRQSGPDLINLSFHEYANHETE